MTAGDRAPHKAVKWRVECGGMTMPFDCQQCGACCETFRVSFYWAEADARGLPAKLTSKVNERFSCMAGTDLPKPRCVALAGKVGEHVACTVYAQRPEACREVQAGDEKCLKARARHGLAVPS